MLEVLQFYTSSFTIWLGITFGISIIVNSFAIRIRSKKEINE